MNNSRIKSVTVHTVPITPQKRVQIERTLSRVYANHTARQLDNMKLSDNQKSDILKKILKSKQI